jgi:phage-related protein
MQESIYTVHPDIVTNAIKLLAAAVVLLTGTLSTLMVYIWQSHKSEWKSTVSEIKSQIDKISESVSKIAEKLFDRTDLLEHRLTEIETVCRNGRCKIVKVNNRRQSKER